MKKTKASVGFTLVELLVVIAIIALLLSMLMPALSKVREQGKKAVCGFNLRTLAQANEVYSNQWNGMYVPTFNYGNAWVSPGKLNGGAWSQGWYGNTDFLSAMGFKRTIHDATKVADYALMPNKFYYCGSDKRMLASHPEYQTWNWCVLFSYSPNAMGFAPASHREIAYMTTKVKQPSGKLMFADSIDYALTTAYSDYYFWDKYGEGIDRSKRPNSVSYRHTNGANIAFFDGHVGWMKKQDIFLRGKSSKETDDNLKRLWLPDPTLTNWNRSTTF